MTNPPTYKYSCVLSYDGGKYSGWQTQPGSDTAQQTLENALSLLDGAHVRATGAGRTDAGVHARGQEKKRKNALRAFCLLF